MERVQLNHRLILRIRARPDSPELFFRARQYNWRMQGTDHRGPGAERVAALRKRVTDWSVEDVTEWLRGEGIESAALTQWLVDEQMDGAAVLALQINQAPRVAKAVHGVLAKMPVSIGVAARFREAIALLAAIERVDPEPPLINLHVQLQGDLTVDALLTLSRSGPLHSASLTHYFKGPKDVRNRRLDPNRRFMNHHFEAGDPLMQVDLFGAVVDDVIINGQTSWETNPNVSLTLMCDAILCHTRVTAEGFVFGVNAARAIVGLPALADVGDAARSRMDMGMTTYVSHDPNRATWCQPWGSSVAWTPQMHRCFPAAFRASVRTLLLARLRRDSPLAALDMSAMHALFRAMGADANVSVFHPFPFTKPKPTPVL